MKYLFMTLLMLACSAAIAQYAPAGDKIKTKWAEEVNPDKVLPEYPRPLMTRSEWKNLNGLWSYSTTSKLAPTRCCGTDVISQCQKAGKASVCCCISAQWIG